MIRVPGKLILSGEHAVVYGKPALAMAVNRYATASATAQLLPLISFDLSDLAYEHGLTFTALNHLKSRIKQNYQRFISGEFKIRHVLEKPVELAQFALSLFLETLNFDLKQGLKIRVQSDIPIGCGMGSSAATVLSVTHAIAHHLQVNLSPEIFYRLSLEAENMQHGYSSGLDLKVSLHGGCFLLKNGMNQSRPLPQLPIYLINTGMPQSTTGECVAFAARYFRDSELGNDFAAVTEAMDQALAENQMAEIQRTIVANQALLKQIGVVPTTVQRFIADITAQGGAAKICGAGSITGEKGGVVLVVTEDLPALVELCSRYHYAILPISGESRGVHNV